MPAFYHGTDETTAHLLVSDPGKLDLGRGGGELGQGFYTTEHVWMAIAWATRRYKHAGAVIEISVDLSDMTGLVIRNLTWEAVLFTWRQLKTQGHTKRYRLGYDVVYGPFALYPHLAQQKFESERAKGALLQSIWRVK